MHRPSAAELAAAPLGHHLQDSTHITYGVITTGVVLGRFKLEASVFNGREPDEERYDFDFAPMDSFALRLGFNPNRNWTAQYSYGWLNEPEALEPGNIDRQTASISYNRPLAQGNWATTLLWGRNHKQVAGTNQNSYLLESNLNFAVRNYLFGRVELVDRDELFHDNPLAGASFRVGAYTIGTARDLVHSENAQISVGADLSFYSKPEVLDPIYGERPVSFRFFVRLRPGLMRHAH
jgi:hypothetical protein